MDSPCFTTGHVFTLTVVTKLCNLVFPDHFSLTPFNDFSRCRLSESVCAKKSDPQISPEWLTANVLYKFFQFCLKEIECR